MLIKPQMQIEAGSVIEDVPSVSVQASTTHPEDALPGNDDHVEATVMPHKRNDSDGLDVIFEPIEYDEPSP